jgi:drug/metabolite transporter (DMT)-like permease
MATAMERATKDPAAKAPGAMNTAAKDPAAFWVHAGLIGVQLAFASHHVVGKLVVRAMPPGALALVRACSAALILLAVHLARSGLPRVPPRDLAKLALCALLGIAANQVLFFEGLARSSAIHVSLLVTTIPVFTLLAGVLSRHEAATGRAFAGVTLALGGAAYLVAGEGVSWTASSLLGDLLVTANSLCYGVYLVLVRPLVQKHGSLRVVVWLFLFGALWILPYGLGDLSRTWRGVDADTWSLVAYVVGIATIFTYLVNAWALGKAPSSMVAIYIYLQPIASALMAILVLGETLSSRVVLAALLVFVGIYLVVRRGEPPPRAPAPQPRA